MSLLSKADDLLQKLELPDEETMKKLGKVETEMEDDDDSVPEGAYETFREITSSLAQAKSSLEEWYSDWGGAL